MCEKYEQLKKDLLENNNYNADEIRYIIIYNEKLNREIPLFIDCIIRKDIELLTFLVHNDLIIENFIINGCTGYYYIDYSDEQTCNSIHSILDYMYDPEVKLLYYKDSEYYNENYSISLEIELSNIFDNEYSIKNFMDALSKIIVFYFEDERFYCLYHIFMVYMDKPLSVNSILQIHDKQNITGYYNETLLMYNVNTETFKELLKYNDPFNRTYQGLNIFNVCDNLENYIELVNYCLENKLFENKNLINEIIYSEHENNLTTFHFIKNIEVLDYLLNKIYPLILPKLKIDRICSNYTFTETNPENLDYLISKGFNVNLRKNIKKTKKINVNYVQ